MIVLYRNESPWDLPETVKTWIARQPWHRYPDDDLVDAVRTCIAQRWGWPSRSITLTNGADEALAILMLWYHRVAYWSPSFSGYQWIAQGWHLDAREVPLTPAFTLCESDLLACRDRLFLMDRPHNPSGLCLFDRLTLQRWLACWEGWIVLDETYGDFADTSLGDLFDPKGRLIVVRSFSKAFGMAGLRLGFMVVPDPIRSAVEQRRLPFNVNRIALYAALWVLEHDSWLRERTALIRQERERIVTRLQALPGVCVWPSQANFVLFRWPDVGPDLATLLQHRGILIRSVDVPGGTRYYRVTVGTPEENEQFLSCVEACYADISNQLGVS